MLWAAAAVMALSFAATPANAGPGTCCTENLGVPGCSDATVEACVCALDSFCCATEWDQICVDEVGDFGCGVCPVPGACCLTAGGCTVTDSAGCTGIGTYQGDGTECSTAGCAGVSPGDDCTVAITAVDGANPFDSTGATTDGISEPSCAFPFGTDEQIFQDRWFEYTSTCTGELFVDTCGGFVGDPRLSIYAGFDCPPLGAPLECNDDHGNATEADTGLACPGGLESSLSIPTVLGNQYLIRVGTFTATTTTGPDALNILCVPDPVGACCTDDGNTCTDGVETVNCTGISFPGELCADVDCPTTGACCAEDGSCTETLPNGCGGYVCDLTALTGATCFADTDANGVVNAADRGQISANIGQTADDLICQFDLDGNGVINAADRGQVSANIGACSALPNYQNGSGLNAAGDGPDPRFPGGGGDFHGVGTTCAETVCGGACCDPDTGACADVMNEGECTGLGGVYQGNGSVCTAGLCPIPPTGNDLCDDAVSLTAGGASHTADNTAATDDAIAACGTTATPNQGIWYQVVGDGTTYTVDTCLAGTNYDTMVNVWCNDCDDLFCVGGNDDAVGAPPECALGTLNRKSRFSWCTTPGQLYTIMVGGFSATFGVSEVRVTTDALTCGSPVGCAPPTGACCTDDAGACTVVSAAMCSGMGGIYRGDGTDCETTECVGACCTGGGACAISREATCDDALGTYIGDGTDCDPNPCALGACCTDDGACNDVSGDDCALAGGRYSGDATTCANVVCEPVGACCNDQLCSEGFRDDCLAGLGSFLGEGTECTGAPCERGACCQGDTCTVEKPDDCATLLGEYQGAATTCDPNPCVDNDLCEDARPLSIPGSDADTTTTATDEVPALTCTVSSPNQARWYQVVGDGTTFTVSTCDPGTTFDTMVQVWCGNCVDPICIGGNDDAAGSPGDPTCILSGGTVHRRSRFSWCTELGEVYLIAVGGFSTTVGDYVVTVSSNATTCTGANACDNDGACCLDSETCVSSTPNACANMGGSFRGVGSDCGTQDCSSNCLTCPSPVATYPYLETFEAGMGGWVDTGTTTFDWIRDSGGTPSTGTGPNVDHTLGTAAGFYMYTEASTGTAGFVDTLEGPCFDISGLAEPELRFWYHMFGTAAGMGFLRVDVSDDGCFNWTTVALFDGPQQVAQADPWLEAVIDLSTFGDVINIRFVGSKDTSFEGDMAIDDIGVGEAGAPPPMGACCQGEFLCTDGTAAECAVAGGTYQGDNTECSTTVCPPCTECAVSYTNCGVGVADDCMDNVTFNTINNTTVAEACPSSYGDYTAISTDVERGQTYAISVQVNNNCDGSGPWNQFAKVWIDWNQNCAFEASEATDLGSTGAVALPPPLTANITVPLDAELGETTMRVIEQFSASPATACSPTSTTFGEAEDYTVNVLPAP